MKLKARDRKILQAGLGNWVAIPTDEFGEHYVFTLFEAYDDKEGWALVYIVDQDREAKVPLASLLTWLELEVTPIDEAQA